MAENEPSLQEILAKLGVNLAELDLNRNLCHCGTMGQALERAEKLVVEIAGTDCPVWAAQVTILAGMSALGILLGRGTSDDAVEYLKTLMIAVAYKTDLPALNERIHQHHKNLYEG